VILGRHYKPPSNVELKYLAAVLDREPTLTEELIALAESVADYYIAPIGEVVRTMLPTDLPAWGDQRVWLSDAGALSQSIDASERAIVEALRDGVRQPVSRLVAELGAAWSFRAFDRLAVAGKVVVTAPGKSSGRYETAVELGKDELGILVERCGRSQKGRDAVQYLAAAGRPATVAEVTAAVGCTASVVKRLVKLGVLRSFTQVSRLSLDHQFLQGMPRSEPVRLRDDQRLAFEGLRKGLQQAEFDAFLLGGVTGSGKTEVYLRAASEALEEGGTAIIMVPEIALVPALAKAARERFGSRIALLHSGLSRSERHQEWERIRSGEARVVLGPRSAVFSPVSDLRLVVVDEEQDPSYKQDRVPRYNGRDVGLLRAHRAGAVVVLVSATPSLESRHNLEISKLKSLQLSRRVGQAQLPEGVLVDLRTEGVAGRPGEIHFSDRLQGEVKATLEAGDQVILLRNRRGYAPLLLCRACGHDIRCDACGLPRTLHRREGVLRCHYCGSGIPRPPTCPACSEQALEPIGAGTERVEEEFRALFPGVAVDVLDRDTARSRGLAAAVLERFARRQTQVLIGTQMVSKGHHFPRVALAAVLLADTYLGFPDFRAVEKTYTLLTQLAGRAGRGDRPGRVVIQTFYPEHYAIQAALNHDDLLFAREEMRFRRIFHYPPFTRMVQLLLKDTNRRRGDQRMRRLAADLVRHPLARELRIAGPAPAPFERLRGKWRFQLLLRGGSGSAIRRLLRDVLPKLGSGDLVVDVDPYELL
jgi:primosomal protein N' (replication factor Y)